jgi:hypothetical protein
MSWFIGPVLVVLISLASPAAAQGDDPSARCAAGALPFPASAENRLTDREIRARFAERSLSYTRLLTVEPSGYVRITRALRADGSLTFRCEVSRDGGTFRECSVHGTRARPAPGASAVGTWSLSGGALCLGLKAYQGESCFSIHHRDGRLAAKLVSGRGSCMEGSIEVR